MIKAQEFYAQQQFPKAEEIFREVLEEEPDSREALESMAIVCLQTGRPQEAEQMLRRLVSAYPQEPLYCDRLATVLLTLDKANDAVAIYRALLESHPEFIDSRYNLARLLKQLGRLEESLDEYQRCLQEGISSPQEVHSNISVILSDLHRHKEAEAALGKALAIQPSYPQAVYNMGLLQEEKGNWAAARSHFQKLLDNDPGHVDAMVRLAFGERFNDPVNPLVRKMTRMLKRDSTEALARENLSYALGKIYDDCARYDEAFDWYEQANQLSRQRVGPYDRQAQEVPVDALIATCDASFLAAIEPVSEVATLFICGMFRSGSTLLEQVLAAHPELVAGGEIDYFPRQLAALEDSYPGVLGTLGSDQLQALGQGYLDTLAPLSVDVAHVSNKRPDNFLYLALIKALFPKARFLHTQRETLDNSLSIYFQPLELALSYANRLEDIGHYRDQYRRLMAHWRELFGDSILEVSYEDLVAEPQATVEGVLGFLGLGWHEDCLRFYETDNRVRTASVSQVREPLYERSVGRWRNYESHFPQT